MELKIAKGLASVHLYAALEKSVNDIVTVALLEIDAYKVKKKDLSVDFHNIASHRQMQSFKDCGHAKHFSKSLDVFGSITHGDVCTIDESIFQYRLQNVWVSTIDEVVRCFGIDGFPITITDASLIDSVVENRNKVAHGRETAAEVGERLNTPHIIRLHDLCAESCEKLCDTFEDFIDKRRFIRPHYKKLYA